MNYDGPSFYKRDHQKNKSDQHEKKEFAWSDKKHLRKNQTREEVMNEAKEYMTPPILSKKKTDGFSKEPKPKNHYFRSKHIPESLQNIGGWERTEWKQDLLLELKERLFKESNSYLLFTNDSEIDEKQEKQEESFNNKQADIKNTKQKKNIGAQKKIAKAHQELKKDLTKPVKGLHRSLSNIIAEDEEAIKTSENNLESLFTHSKR